MTEVAAALIWDQDRFLIGQRPAHKARGLLWEFVGGKAEPGVLPGAPGVDGRVGDRYVSGRISGHPGCVRSTRRTWARLLLRP